MITRTVAALFLILSASSHSAVGVETEEQRKYFIPNLDEAAASLLETGGVLGPFDLKGHSVYEYSDIYLDTPDYRLYKKFLSMRLRRRVYEDGKVEYGFQIKGEMTEKGAIRMEVEEDQLEIYQRRGEKLIEHLNVLFDLTEKDTEPFKNSRVLQSITWIEDWIKFKASGSVAPLQEIRHQFGEVLDSLTPMILVHSRRARSHIVVDRNRANEFKNLPDSLKSNPPPTLPSGSQIVWVMESSLDRSDALALSRPASGAPERTQFSEFEVENKYAPAARGTELMVSFEKSLSDHLGAQTTLSSKYRQSARVLFNLEDALLTP